MPYLLLILIFIFTASLWYFLKSSKLWMLTGYILSEQNKRSQSYRGFRKFAVKQQETPGKHLRFTQIRSHYRYWPWNLETIWVQLFVGIAFEVWLIRAVSSISCLCKLLLDGFFSRLFPRNTVIFRTAWKFMA